MLVSHLMLTMHAAGTIKSQEVTDDKDLNYLQGEVADNAGGIVGKGGVGEDIGETVSKSL